MQHRGECSIERVRQMKECSIEENAAPKESDKLNYLKREKISNLFLGVSFARGLDAVELRPQLGLIGAIRSQRRAQELEVLGGRSCVRQ
jgi:hypothetical protein